jgi:hypothetical protein
MTKRGAIDKCFVVEGEGASMFVKFFNKVSDFASHHQVIIAVVVATCVVFATWGLENLVERYFLPNHKSVLRYFVALIGSGLILWFIQHTVLHVI